VTFLIVIYAWARALAGASRSIRRWLSAGFLAVSLAGCGGGVDFGELFSDTGQPSGRQEAQTQRQPQVPQVGQGAPRVALLLPLSAAGGMGRIARAMKKSAELAMIDAGNPGITLVVKDTSGTPAGARMAAQAAIGEGARLILGPLLAGSVKAVAPEAAARNVPVIAFSSQASVAGNGVYLMSFLPGSEVDNVVRYAVRAGKRNIAALIPQTAYGSIAARALYQAAKRYKASIIAEERYVATPSGITAPASRLAKKLASPTSKADALFFPGAPKMVKAASAPMTQAGFTPAAAQLLGTGLWDSAAIRTAPLAIGGWYAGVEPRLVKYFSDHYAQSYGAKPPRLASLAYDATSLAISLGKSSFSAREIQNPEGFQGMNGLFRFRSNGLIQRGLAILQVTPSGPSVVSPAPSRFSSGY